MFRGCTPTSKVLHPVSERCSVPSQQVGHSVRARGGRKLLDGAGARGTVFDGIHQGKKGQEGENSNVDLVQISLGPD